MSSTSPNWNLVEPTDGESDSAAKMDTLVSAIDSALLAPADKAALIGGGGTILHTHDSSTLTGHIYSSLEVTGTAQFDSQAVFDSVVDNGTSAGTTKTIDFTAGNKQKLILGSTSTVALSFTAPSGACSLTLMLIQDVTGGRRVSFPSNVKWSNGVAPILTTMAGKVDIVSLLWDGLNYYSAASLNF